MTVAGSLDTRGRARHLAVGGMVGRPAVVRLAFYVFYYALNASFVAEWFTVVLTLPTFVLCCVNLARIEEDRATARDMIWLVIYIFFVVAPCQSLFGGYFENDGPVQGLRFDAAVLATASLIVFLFLLVVTITTAVVDDPRRRRTVAFALRDGSFPLLVTANAAAFVLYVVAVGGLGNALADRLSKEEFSSPVATAFLAAQLVTALLCCVAVASRPRRLPRLAALALVLGLLLISQNPFNAARYFLLIAWLPVLLVWLRGRIGLGPFYVSALLGLLVLMPILNFTGRHGLTLSEATETIDLAKFLFKIPYVDVFDVLAYAVDVLQRQDFLWGAKTLSLVLFVVPRDLWTGKEVLLVKQLGEPLVEAGIAGTDNLSLFFAAEFYADLGLVGVAIGAFVVSLPLTVYGLDRTVTIDGHDLRGYVAMASAPILIRGPLGAVIPLTFLMLVLLAVATRLVCRRLRHATRADPRRAAAAT